MPTLPSENATSTVEILRLFRELGHSSYGGEAVTQLEHALQAAYLAEQDNAEPSLIVAALLHDIGHLLHSLPSNAPERGVDDRHETLAARWLEQRFGPEVIEPVRLHVDAKRFLCAVDPDYLNDLSPASLLSLKLQGGVMSDEEAAEFTTHPYYGAAVALRHWDDAAKVPNLATPPIEHFVIYLDEVLPEAISKDS